MPGRKQVGPVHLPEHRKKRKADFRACSQVLNLLPRNGLPGINFPADRIEAREESFIPLP